MSAGCTCCNRWGLPNHVRVTASILTRLSGGMRQRAMIAMALVCNPNLLIADEPTTALDVTIQAQILELMLQLQDDLGMAIMLITHNLSVVAETADRVSVMYMGRILESTDVRTLFRRPLHPYTVGLFTLHSQTWQACQGTSDTHPGQRAGSLLDP